MTTNYSESVMIASCPSTGEETCHRCRAIIAGRVYKVFSEPDTVIFLCLFCLGDPDEPIEVVLTGLGKLALEVKKENKRWLNSLKRYEDAQERFNELLGLLADAIMAARKKIS